MFPLDAHTTQILAKIMDTMEGKDTHDLRVPDHPLLRLTLLFPVETEQGTGFTISIGQLYRIHPPLYKVRMVLLVVDGRNRRTGKGPVTAFPVSYHDEVNEVMEVGAWMTGDQVRKFNEATQRSLATYARTWLVELHTAGYF